MVQNQNLHFKPLGISCVYVISYTVGVFYWKDTTFSHAFLEALIKGFLIFITAGLGLALSRKLDFEPLPLVQTIKSVKKVGSWLLFTVIAFILILAATRIISMAVYPISVNVLGEAFPDETFFKTYFGDTPFFALVLLFFAGAGIAEEVLFRLFTMNVIWYYTKNVYTAVILSSFIFGMYHLTPLNSLYQIFWGFPFYQVATCTVTGILLGLTYKKVGFESVVIIHTFINIF